MKMQNKLILLCIILMITVSVQVHAQSDPPPFGGTVTDEAVADPPAFNDDVADLVPIDGGLTLLLAAGVAFGAKKAHQYRKLKAD
jgi:hypothetical protein